MSVTSRSDQIMTTEQPPLGELVKQTSEQVSELIREEMRLARLELAQKGKRVGVGAGLFGGAGVIAAYGVGVLIAAAVLGIANGLPAWLSALIVGVALLLFAGVMVLIGRRQVKAASPPIPTEMMASLKKDANVFKERARS